MLEENQGFVVNVRGYESENNAEIKTYKSDFGLVTSRRSLCIRHVQKHSQSIDSMCVHVSLN